MRRQLLGRFPRPAPATVIAIAALVLAAGGFAVAAIPASDGTIHGCYATNGGEHYGDATTLRTDGALQSGGNNLDYGAFDGGTQSENNPITFDGTVFGAERLDQFGSGTNIYTAYAPRTTGLNNLITPYGSVPPLGSPASA